MGINDKACLPTFPQNAPATATATATAAAATAAVAPFTAVGTATAVATIGTIYHCRYILPPLLPLLSPRSVRGTKATR